MEKIFFIHQNSILAALFDMGGGGGGGGGGDQNVFHSCAKIL